MGHTKKTSLLKSFLFFYFTLMGIAYLMFAAISKDELNFFYWKEGVFKMYLIIGNAISIYFGYGLAINYRESKQNEDEQ